MVSGVMRVTQWGGRVALYPPFVSVVGVPGGIMFLFGLGFVLVTLNRHMGFGGTF